MGPIEKSVSIAQVMAWCGIGHKPLPESVMAKIWNDILQNELNIIIDFIFAM